MDLNCTEKHTCSQHYMLLERVHMIPAAEKVLNVSSRRRRFTESDVELVRHVEVTNWTMTANTEEDFLKRCFAEMLLRCVKKPSEPNLDW